MATAVDFRKDFLTCTICYDVYNKPKSLPCLHTFCLRCLSSYIAAEDETFGVQRKGAFPCPICRALAKPPVPSRPLRLWADDFKTNFYIESLMSALEVRGSKKEQTTQLEKMMNTIVSPEPSSQRDSSSSLSDSNVYSSESVTITSLSPPGKAKSYELVKGVSTAMPGDKGESKLCGICLVENVIVCLDSENNRVKTFFNWRAVLDVNVVCKALDLPGAPQSITKISNSAVAVTVPYIPETRRRAIYLIQVTPHLQIISTTYTARAYSSIAESGSGSFVALAQPSHSRLYPIDIVSYDGVLLKSIDISLHLKDRDFSHISVSNSGLIHLVDSTNNVYCITQDGVELYAYKPNDKERFTSLKGLCCRFGDLYLTDFENDSVYEIKCDCSLPLTRAEILTDEHGIYMPTDVHIEPDGTIFVACWDGIVRVYSLKAKPSILKRPEETAV